MDQIQIWINHHREQMVQDLIDIVRIPSISTPSQQYPPFGRGCRDVLDAYLTLCAKFGYEVHNYEYYIGEATCGLGKTSIGIWSHLDVVPAPNPEAWSYPPFAGSVVRDRYIIGRGVQDNKMPAIGMLYALNYLRENGIPLRHRYSLFAGTSEENGMADVRYFCRQYKCPTLNLVPDSGFPVCIAERGNCMLRVYTAPLDAFAEWSITCNPLPGLAADSAEAVIPGQERILVTGEALRLSERKPEQPVAPELLLEQLVQRTDGEAQKALQTLLRVASDTSGGCLEIACEDAQTGKLHASAGRIGIENGCVFMELTITLPACTKVDTLQQTIDAACAEKGLSSRILKLRAPHSFPAGHPVVKRLTSVYQDVTGYSDEPFVMSGGSYAGQLPRAFAYGPGMPGRVFPSDIFRPGCGDYHQVDESEDIEHFCMFTRIYIHALLALNDMELQFEGEQA